MGLAVGRISVVHGSGSSIGLGQGALDLSGLGVADPGVPGRHLLPLIFFTSTIKLPIKHPLYFICMCLLVLNFILICYISNINIDLTAVEQKGGLAEPRHVWKKGSG